jgi:autotransporter-associated beta strand protein
MTHRSTLSWMLCVTMLFSAAVVGRAQDADGFWSKGGGGSWANANNWESGTIADGTNNAASFGVTGLEPPMPLNATFTLDGTRAIGSLNFYPTNTSVNWTLSTGGGGPLTLANDIDYPGIYVSMANVTISLVLAGSDGLEKLAAGTLILSGTNTYTGGTVVSAGTLLVNGAITDSGAVSNLSGTLGGIGWIAGPVFVQSGCNLAPGSSGIGTLAISNSLALAAGSKTIMQLNASTSAHDAVAGLSNVVYGGTLVVSNLAGTPALGQSYQLFSATGSAGNFSSLTPQLSNGLRWRFAPATGVLSVVSTASQPQFAGVSLSGASVVLQAVNGAPGVTNYLLSSTNLALPLTNWTRVGTNVFDAGGNGVFSNAVNLNLPGQFYSIAVPPTL